MKTAGIIGLVLIVAALAAVASSAGYIKGFCLGALWWPTFDRDLVTYNLYRLAEIGVNSIAIHPNWFVETYRDSTLEPWYRDRPGFPETNWWFPTLYDAEIEFIAQMAHSLGMSVMIKLYVSVLDDPITHMGGFALHPDGDRWDELFESYQEYANHYASLCEELSIEILCLGTELETMTHAWPDEHLADPDRRWRELIEEVRGIYSGKLTYSCALGGSWEKPWSSPQGVTFWDALDYIGVELYQGLSDTMDPTLEQLKEALRSDFAEYVEPLVEKYDRPILIPEIGPQNCDGSNMSPYSPFSPPSAQLDLDEQAMYYEAILDVIDEISTSKDYFAGIYWWNGQLVYPWVDYTIDPNEEGCGGTMIWGTPSEQALRDAWERTNGWTDAKQYELPSAQPAAAGDGGCSVRVLRSSGSDSLVIEAMAAPGWLFSNWEGDVTLHDYPFTACPEEDLATARAFFVPCPCIPVHADASLDLMYVDGFSHPLGSVEAFWFAGGPGGQVGIERVGGSRALVYDYAPAISAKAAIRFPVPFDASGYEGAQFVVRGEMPTSLHITIASRDSGLCGLANADDYKSSILWTECHIEVDQNAQMFRVPFSLFRDQPWMIEEYPGISWRPNLSALWEIEFYPQGASCLIEILEVAFYKSTEED